MLPTTALGVADTVTWSLTGEIPTLGVLSMGAAVTAQPPIAIAPQSSKQKSKVFLVLALK